jgi:hypothetical protein
VIYESSRISDFQLLGLQTSSRIRLFSMLHLDYLSCALTILSTCLVSRRMWQGWVVASANSVVICIIGFRTAQLGFVPANLFCLALYVQAIYRWRRPAERTASTEELASHVSSRCAKPVRPATARSLRRLCSISSVRVPAKDGPFARSSDRVLSRNLPARH